MLTTTFRQLREAGACKGRYRVLAKSKGGVRNYGLDTPIFLLDILDSNGLDDTLWSLRACIPEAERDRFARLFACDCAERVLSPFEAKLPDDTRPRQAIETARRFANGNSSTEELGAARDAAGAAAGDAAGNAAWAAAWNAAGDAAWAAAWAAAWNAAGDAAWAAAWNAAGNAAWAAAGDAAWAAAWAAGNAAGDAAWAAAWNAAWAAAGDAERGWQSNHLREMLAIC